MESFAEYGSKFEVAAMQWMIKTFQPLMTSTSDSIDAQGHAVSDQDCPIRMSEGKC